MPDLISVVIPVYNGEKYLAEAIESVLAQTHRTLEVIVVNDGSSDGSEQVAKSFGNVRYFHQSNLGNAAARNRGVENASADYVAFLDQDDRFAPEKLEKQLASLQTTQKSYSICHGRFFLHEGQSWPSWVEPRFRGNDHLCYVPGSILAHTSAFDLIGPFDSHYALGSDSDWFFRAKDAGLDPAIVEESLLYKRVHDKNQSNNVRTAHHELLRVVQASIARKRINA